MVYFNSQFVARLTDCGRDRVTSIALHGADSIRHGAARGFRSDGRVVRRERRFLSAVANVRT